MKTLLGVLLLVLFSNSISGQNLEALDNNYGFREAKFEVLLTSFKNLRKMETGDSFNSEFPYDKMFAVTDTGIDIGNYIIEEIDYDFYRGLTDSVKDSSSIMSQVTITILYDNVSYDTMFTPANGFSCFITGLGKTILFDTGGDPDILLHNMKQANIDPDRIQYLVISHIHRDHIGGLIGETVWKNMETVFLPVKLDSLGEGIERVTSLPVELFPHVFLKRVDSLPIGLFPHVFLTGVMPPVPANIIHGNEQSLIIDTPQGLVLITGCAHPGIVSILKRAKEIVNKDIYLVLGGFHLLDQTDEQIKTVVDSFKSVGVRYVGPMHCTGDKAKAAFREAYGDHYLEMGAGRKITLDKDGLLLFGH